MWCPPIILTWHWGGQGADPFQSHHAECAGQAGDQGQPTELPERQVLFDQPDLLLELGDLIQGMRNRLWLLTTRVLVKSLTLLPYRILWEKVTGVAWRGALLTELKTGWLARTCIQLAASLQWCSPGLRPGPVLPDTCVDGLEEGMESSKPVSLQ